eukprot:NODE_1333_length_901_cov_60.381137_g1287_i0.p1 GENE.NODE_1333_length_901_cov_60.381137_g1287_i0~~NODE_1333_length_901_cov_60.381137_g1287_i0.p1  ORF type:complete len:261 (+),score=52.83 NODE_1333_length_901_cov_60.381137_g1287_i0:65-784(+)
MGQLDSIDVPSLQSAFYDTKIRIDQLYQNSPQLTVFLLSLATASLIPTLLFLVFAFVTVTFGLICFLVVEGTILVIGGTIFFWTLVAIAFVVGSVFLWVALFYNLFTFGLSLTQPTPDTKRKYKQRPRQANGTPPTVRFTQDSTIHLIPDPTEDPVPPIGNQKHENEDTSYSPTLESSQTDKEEPVDLPLPGVGSEAEVEVAPSNNTTQEEQPPQKQDNVAERDEVEQEEEDTTPQASA